MHFSPFKGHHLFKERCRDRLCHEQPLALSTDKLRHGSISSLLRFPITLFVIFLLLIMNGAADAFQCADVDTNISPCLPYLTSKDSTGSPSDSCCKGMETIKELGKEKEDREEICRCLEKDASELPDINPDKIPLLPEECGINLDFPIAMDIDCSKIH